MVEGGVRAPRSEVGRGQGPPKWGEWGIWPSVTFPRGWDRPSEPEALPCLFLNPLCYSVFLWYRQLPELKKSRSRAYHENDFILRKPEWNSHERKWGGTMGKRVSRMDSAASCLHSSSFVRYGNSPVVGTFTVCVWVPSLVEELRSCKLCAGAKH